MLAIIISKHTTKHYAIIEYGIEIRKSTCLLRSTCTINNVKRAKGNKITVSEVN